MTKIIIIIAKSQPNITYHTRMRSHVNYCYNAHNIVLAVLFSLLLLVDGDAVRAFDATYRDVNIDDTRVVLDSNRNGSDQENPDRPRRRDQQEVQRKQKGQQNDILDYKLWEASRIPEVLKEWEVKYPDLIRVTTSQEAYGLPAAGSEEDCPFYENEGCPNYFFTIQDYVVHPIDSPSSSHLPEVFWSGCLHGNERVGPTSVMEASTLLLESAYCEGLPRSSSLSSLDSDMKEAKTCRDALRNKGIDDVHRKWLARLVSTRRIVVVPTTNGK